jgi:predicted phosphodiesterase
MSAIRHLGVIGDLHAEDIRLGQALEFLENEGVRDIICTGDIADGRGCADTSIRLLRDHKVQTVRGNHDRWLLENKARHVPDAHHRDQLNDTSVAYLESLPTQIQMNTVAGSLLLCHGIADNDLRKVWPGTERMPVERSHELDHIIDEGKHRFLINGHVHFKTMIHFQNLTLLNAGTLKGDLWPGFTLIDFELRLIRAFTFGTDEPVTLTKTTNLDPESSHRIWENTQAFNGNWDPLLLFNRTD